MQNVILNRISEEVNQPGTLNSKFQTQTTLFSLASQKRKHKIGGQDLDYKLLRIGY